MSTSRKEGEVGSNHGGFIKAALHSRRTETTKRGYTHGVGRKNTIRDVYAACILQVGCPVGMVGSVYRRMGRRSS